MREQSGPGPMPFSPESIYRKRPADRRKHEVCKAASSAASPLASLSTKLELRRELTLTDAHKTRSLSVAAVEKSAFPRAELPKRARNPCLSSWFPREGKGDVFLPPSSLFRAARGSISGELVFDSSVVSPLPPERLALIGRSRGQ